MTPRARLMVAGGFQRSGPHLRITARIVDLAGGDVLADAKVDGLLADVFSLQDGIVRSFARELDLPAAAVHARVLSLIFLRLIKSIIAPLLFGTLVVGIGAHVYFGTTNGWNGTVSLTGGDFPEGLFNLLRRQALEEVAVRAVPQGGLDVEVVGFTGEHEHLGAGQGAELQFQLAGQRQGALAADQQMGQVHRAVLGIRLGILVLKNERS